MLVTICLTLGMLALLGGTLMADAEFGESVIRLPSLLILWILLPLLYCMSQL